MNIGQHISKFFYSIGMAWAGRAVTRISVFYKKAENDIMASEYVTPECEMVRKYGIIPPVHRLEFGEITNISLLSNGKIRVYGIHYIEDNNDPETFLPVSITLDPKNGLDNIWYDEKNYCGKSLFALYREFENTRLETALESL